MLAGGIFEKKSKRIATLNTNVANPDYKPPTPKLPIPAEQNGPSKKDKKGIAKPEKKVHDYHEEKVSVKNEISINCGTLVKSSNIKKIRLKII